MILDKNEFSSSSRFIINLVSYCQISLTKVVKVKNGFRLVSASWISKFLYIFCLNNTILKFVYLLGLVNGFFGPVDFLDRMCALLWMLMCTELLQELLFWGSTYPLFEIFSNLWKLENQIYESLLKPRALNDVCRRTNFNTIWIHLLILVVGCFLIGGQFLSDPKYSVYTYAGFPYENNVCLILFAAHEVCFMWHAWHGYLSIVTLGCVNAVELTTILSGITEAVYKMFPRYDDKKIKSSKSGPLEKVSLNRRFGKLNLVDIVYARTHKGPLHIDPTVPCPGTVSYDINSIMKDYKCLMLTSDLLNSWCSYRIVGIHSIGYCQFISDVFMMMQLLKLPDTDIPTVMWFGEDALVCIYMIFRTFSLMSRVSSASEKFLLGFQHYLRFSNPKRKEFRKIAKSWRPVALKLGPSPMKPSTVGAAVMMLLNYYLVVALWKN